MNTKPNMKPNFSAPSRLLISTLIATSFFMVNCNKGTDKMGVKGKAAPGQAAPAKVEKTGSEIAACSESILKSYAVLAEAAKRVQNLKKSEEHNKVISMCKDLDSEFDKASLKSCQYPLAKDKTEKVVLTKAPSQCAMSAKLLKAIDGTESEYLKSADDQKIIADVKSNNGEQFKMVKLLMSEEMKTMLKQENLNFKKYIVDGEIKSSPEDMQKAFEARKVVCSFTETSTEVPEKEKIYLNVQEYVEADVQNMPEGIQGMGLAMAVSTVKATDDSGIFQKLDCSQLSKDKIDIKLLKQALGKHLISDADLKKTEKQEILLKQTEAAAAAQQKIRDDFRKEERKSY